MLVTLLAARAFREAFVMHGTRARFAVIIVGACRQLS